MPVEGASTSARVSSAASPRARPKSAWQQRQTSAGSARPKSGSSRTSVTTRASRQSSIQPNADRGGDDDDGDEMDKSEDQDRKQSRGALETELKTMTACYENANRRSAELEIRCSDLSRKNRKTALELDQNKERLHELERENSVIHRKLSSLSTNLDTTKSRLTNMEWKAMEYEKLSILNDNLKNKNESLRQDNRDLERQLRQTQTDLEDTQKLLESKQQEVERSEEMRADLRLQVREEAVKNMQLDKQVDDLQYIRNQSAEKDELISKLKTEVEETQLKLTHARKSWKDERGKVTEQINTEKAQEDLREEAEMVRAENMTLKKMLVAKDSLLIQKTRTLDNIKNRLQQSTNELIEVQVLCNIMNSKPAIKPSFPIGNKIKQEYQSNGNGLPINGWMDESQRPKSSHSKISFFDTILQDDNKSAAQVDKTSPPKSIQQRGLKTAIVKPNNYQSLSFGDFRTSLEILDEAPADKQTQPENNNFEIKQSPYKVKREASMNGKTCVTSANTANDASRLRRTKSAENRMHCRRMDEPVYSSHSASSWSSSRTSSVSISTVGSAGSSYVPAIMLKVAPEKDRLYSKVLHIGDRVYIDMSRSNDKRKHNFQQGVVKFIGNLDKEYDCYRIYMGVKLDEPNGDTNGIYKSKRYFKVSDNYGKFIRITRVTSVLNKQSNRFQDIGDILKQYESSSSKTTTPTESHEKFQLKL